MEKHNPFQLLEMVDRIEEPIVHIAELHAWLRAQRLTKANWSQILGRNSMKFCGSKSKAVRRRETNKRIKLEAPETLVSHGFSAIPSSQTSTGELKQLALGQCKSQESLIGAADVPIHPEMDDEDELPPYHELHEQRNFREKAIALMEHKGMNLSALEPSIEGVLQPFLHRYHNGLNQENDVQHLWNFSYEKHWEYVPPQFMATLKISGISQEDREFKGTEWCCSHRKAQMSAIRVFCEDAEVQAIAEQLPPPYPKIRDSCKLKRGERLAVGAAGMKLKDVLKELTEFLYLRFRALGCRTALWDGNS